MKNTDNKKRNRKIAAAVGTVAAVALIGGTYAWLQSSDSKVNHFEGGLSGNDVGINETWTPPTNWMPGQAVVKEVGVMNTGQYNEFIRVDLTENLQLLSNATPTFSATAPAEGAGFLVPMPIGGYTSDKGWTPVTVNITDGGYTLHVLQKEGPDQTDPNTGATTKAASYVLYWEKGGETFQAKLADGFELNHTTIGSLTKANVGFDVIKADYGTDVAKDWKSEKSAITFTAQTAPTPTGTATDWFKVPSLAAPEIELSFVNISDALNDASDSWYYNKDDGYFYYLNVVKSGDATVDFLNSVKLADEADSKFTKVKYDLTVNAQAIQPVAQAAADVWGLKADSDLYKLYDKISKSLEGAESGNVNGSTEESTQNSNDGQEATEQSTQASGE